MKIEVRPARADEMDQFGLIGAYVYAGAFGDGPDNIVSQNNRPEWTLCAFDGARMAASYSCLPFTMRANGNAVAMGGVTAVGTLPEYRRQGLVRAITTRSFADMRERGQAVAALWASQAAIYQRYGYALSSALVTYCIDSVDVGFGDGDGGSMRIARVDADTGAEIMKKVYIDFVAQRTCYLHRSKTLWMNGVLSSSPLTGPVNIAVAHAANGAPTGYVAYHVRNDKTGHPTRGQELLVKDLVWLNVDAYRSLWTWLARHDLVGRITWLRAPIDDPAPELFVEPRLLNAQPRDGIWLRIIDAQAALALRGYQTDGAITLEIAKDDLTPWNEGRVKLECSADGATVTPSKGNADITLSVKALASLYTGYRSARQLSQWGMLEGDDAAIERATRTFATRYAPHCPDNF
jgi:predicted acetyltransferase